jgi:hypothetical protein
LDTTAIYTQPTAADKERVVEQSAKLLSRGRCYVSDNLTRQVYERARLGGGLALGSHPAVLVVDFSCGFTDPECRLGADLTKEIQATRRVLDSARARRLPIIFTTIAFGRDLKDGGLWLQKAPALRDLTLGGRWVEIDPRLGVQANETVVVKKGASGSLERTWLQS